MNITSYVLVNLKTSFKKFHFIPFFKFIKQILEFLIINYFFKNCPKNFYSSIGFISEFLNLKIFKISDIVKNTLKLKFVKTYNKFISKILYIG